MNLRLSRVNKALVHIVSSFLRDRFREEASHITVVGAMVSPDLQSALIKYSTLGGESDIRVAKKFFAKYRILITKHVAEKLQLRRTITLRLEHTDAIEKGNHLVEILDYIEKEEVS